jgi:hypothetical protein
MLSLLCRENRKIALLMDNAPTHAVPDYEVEEEHVIKFIQLSNIKLIFYQLPSRASCSPLTRASLPGPMPTTGTIRLYTTKHGV